jgi:hypothetical protein
MDMGIIQSVEGQMREKDGGKANLPPLLELEYLLSLAFRYF